MNVEYKLIEFLASHCEDVIPDSWVVTSRNLVTGRTRRQRVLAYTAEGAIESAGKRRVGGAWQFVSAVRPRIDVLESELEFSQIQMALNGVGL